jgi:hypothetical protein
VHSLRSCRCRRGGGWRRAGAEGRPTILVPDGVLDHLLARETALARPNMPLLDRFFARFTYW